MTNLEYIKSLSGRETAALVDALMGADDEIAGEQCRECKYYREGEDFLCGAGGLAEAEENNRECRRATISWLYAEARALKMAVEKEEMKARENFGRGGRMSDEELITALKRMSIETGGIICLGCGHEHGCSVHGCAILKEAAERIGKAEREQAAAAGEKNRRYEVFVVTRDRQGRRSIERKQWTMQPEERKI